jgi:hypothetical protein
VPKKVQKYLQPSLLLPPLFCPPFCPTKTNGTNRNICQKACQVFASSDNPSKRGVVAAGFFFFSFCGPPHVT